MCKYCLVKMSKDDEGYFCENDKCRAWCVTQTKRGELQIKLLEVLKENGYE